MHSQLPKWIIILNKFNKEKKVEKSLKNADKEKQKTLCAHKCQCIEPYKYKPNMFMM